MLNPSTRIVAAVDLSSASKAVVEAAASLASSLQAEVWLVHVVIPEPPWAASGDIGFTPMPAPPAHAEILHDRRRMLDDLETILTSQDIPAHSILVEHPTTAALVNEVSALDPDLIVIGSHRHGSWHHALLGSTRERLLKHAPCPVLVVPVPGPQILTWTRASASESVGQPTPGSPSKVSSGVAGRTPRHHG
ncbi:MAG TPA: universal stress protein [Polyangiaceae bacterium]|mgnify:CR=1 FL=1|nr:universal stress protein [Polyangiaceae bacterium]